MAAIPVAPALIQELASSRMLRHSCVAEGVPPSNTQELRCLQMDQAMSKMSEERPFLYASGVLLVVACHQSRNRVPAVGA